MYFKTCLLYLSFQHPHFSPIMVNQELLTKAKAGDVKAFHKLYAEFQGALKSYLYRLTANRNDMEDLAQDVFILAFDSIGSFKAQASLKTWVFTIATNLAMRRQERRRKWFEDTHDRVRHHAHANQHLLEALDSTSRSDPEGIFEIREHISYCFTCTSHMLPIDQQVALLLKDIYQFKVDEVAGIMSRSRGSVKHLLHDARKTMVRIFDDQCVLVSKRGTCNQCSQLNGRFNPKQDTQARLRVIEMVKERSSADKRKLYQLRTSLTSALDPIASKGQNLHELFFTIAHEVNAAE